MRAVQITRFGGPEVLDVVDIPEPEAGPGQQLYDVSAAGVNYADTHHRESFDLPELRPHQAGRRPCEGEVTSTTAPASAAIQPTSRTSPTITPMRRPFLRTGRTDRRAAVIEER